MKKNYILVGIIFLLIGLIALFIVLIEQEELKPAAAQIKDDGPEIILEESEVELLEIGEIEYVDDSVLEPGFPVDLSYDKYLTTYTYIYIEKDSVNIFTEPGAEGKAFHRLNQGERLDYFESIYIKAGDGNTEKWIHAGWEEGKEKLFGFIKESDIILRNYQFDKAEEAIKKIEAECERGGVTYVSNYKNVNGYAPLYKGDTVDSRGVGRSQSVPGYFSLDDKSEFNYIEDGSLVRHLFTQGEYIKVQNIFEGKQYFVPAKYMPDGHRIHNLTRLIAVDVTNQNEMVYEKKSDDWTLISYTQATTGTSNKYSRPTSRGFFFGIEKRPYFRYYEDGTTNIQGYAPYAIRFSGGAYVHGIGVNYKHDKDGNVITPPHEEYSKTIGTVPLSHKCVRNYTSHAKFLYDWFIPGETVVVVID